MTAVRLALTLGYLSGEHGSVAADAAHALDLTRAAEAAGYACAWVGEAYGTDAPTVLAWLAAQTRDIDLGSAVMQVPARSAAATAMTAATLDALSGGRFRLGVGVSGPQVSAGWHGVPFDAPLARTRAYVEVVRAALARKPLTHEGPHLPLPPPGYSGPALRLAQPAPRADLPVYLAALGPKNVELAGEIADGWLPVFFSPEHPGDAAEHLAAGRGRRESAGRAGGDGFDVCPSVPLVVTGAGEEADADEALGRLRAHTALYLGGMGSRKLNVYAAAATRMGFGEQATAVQDLYLERRQRDAAAAVPDALLATTALVGDRDHLAERLSAYAAAGVSTVSVMPMAADPAARQRAVATAAAALADAGLEDAAPEGHA